MPSLDEIQEHPKLKDKDEYEERLKKHQLSLLLLERRIYQKSRRAIIAFEGWDAAGKGGAIRRLTERLDPRGFKVYPIAAPRPEEKAHHYLWRFWQRLPGPGEIAIFDRTWYGRVLVERIEGFARKDEWKRAYDEINQFEKLMVDDGVPVIKFFIHITKKEQLRRFRERVKNPYKDWKIGPEDWRNRKRWKQYERAIDDMFERTDTGSAPWHLVAGNHKWFARTEILRRTVESLEDWV
ncbi:MAG TPA: polyphosphate kinase [Planctomycetota bacterium]|nr:polyphosphate kinase [Planctomycetota bacterium]